MKNKGVSPIIAAVLLIAFTISVALIAGPFFTQTLKDSKAGTNQNSEDILASTNADLEINEVKLSSETGKYKITLQNKGESPISNFTTTIYKEKPVQKKQDVELKPAEITTYSIDTNSTEKPEKIVVSARNLPVEAVYESQNILTGSAPASPTLSATE